MYFPHKYRTLNGRKGGEDGLPVDYEYNAIESIELYDLSEDVSETKNVAAEYPEVVQKISSLGDEIREELGDSLTDQEGEGTRLAGIIE